MRRENSLHQGGGVLPSGYRELNYIGYDNRNGDQYILTDISYVSWNFSYYFEVYIPQKVNINDPGDYAYNYDFMTPHGVYGTNSNRNKLLVSQVRCAYPSPSFKTVVFPTPIDYSVLHTISETYSTLTVDGVTYNLSRGLASNYVNQHNLLLLRGGDVGSGDRSSGSGKLVRVKVWDENGTLVLDGYPALREYDSKPGLYDVIGNKFYTNAGTGEFTYE